MRTHTLKVAPLVALTLLAACVAHDKEGDKYAALGDWKNAYANYRQALADKPQDAALKQKFEDSKARALQDATTAANGCAAQKNWECALQESDFVLSVDPSRADIGAVRQKAAAQVALSRLGQVQAEVVAGRFPAAAGLIQQAHQLSNDPAVEAEARRATQVYSSGVSSEADKLRGSKRYAEAIALLQAGAAVDPGLRVRLEATQREYEGWKSAEHDRFLAEGEGHLSAGRWPEAEASFRSALQLKADDRSRVLGQYAKLMQAGDDAVKRGDWAGASRSYGDAAVLRVDRGYAAEQRDRATVRPWSVSLKTVLVTPLRPNRTPWVGERERRLDRLQEILANAWGDPLQGRVLAALGDAPRGNRPDVVVEVTLPDGTRLVTRPERALFLAPRVTLVVAANAFDPRKLAFRVFQQLPGGQAEDIGYAEAQLGELVGKRALVLQDRAIGAIELAVDPAEGAREGTYTGLTPVAPPPPPAPVKTSPPPPATRPPAPPAKTSPPPPATPPPAAPAKTSPPPPATPPPPAAPAKTSPPPSAEPAPAAPEKTSPPPSAAPGTATPEKTSPTPPAAPEPAGRKKRSPPPAETPSPAAPATTTPPAAAPPQR